MLSMEERDFLLDILRFKIINRILANDESCELMNALSREGE